MAKRRKLYKIGGGSPDEMPARLIGFQSGRCSEAEYIAMKMQALKKARPKDPVKPVTIRKFSWED